MRHVPVLLNETIDSLQLKLGMNVIDCTLGDAGHAEKILEKIGLDGKLLGIDADAEAILRAKQYLYSFNKQPRLRPFGATDGQVIFVRDNFVNLKKIIVDNHFESVDAILLDLGWSSPQFEERGRGFSFLKEGEQLGMGYGAGLSTIDYGLSTKTASELVNELSDKELERIFREYGEEKLSREIAKAIVEARKEKEIKTVGNLVDIILEVYRKKLKTKKEIPWVGGLHPATKVFQALRIAVNDELRVLEKVLPQAVESLIPGGRLAVITFHSLEDRIVKHFFKSQEGKSVGLINKKPIVCSKQEWDENPKARSAKLRVVEKI